MKTIVGLFDDSAQAQNASSNLEAAGIARNDISFMANNEDRRYGTVEVAPDNGDRMLNATINDAEWGAAIGGGLGLLAGASLFVIPGFGWIAGAGWLAGLLGGAALGGIVGGLFGALTHIGVPEEDAAYYTEGVRRGGYLLAVRADDAQASRVAQILDDAGAVDIDQRGATYRNEGFQPSTYYGNSSIPAVSTSAMASANVAAANRSRVHDYRGNWDTPADHIARDVANSGIEGNIPGIQTGGRALDGTPDTRGIMEKTADALTGDAIDDKTGKVVR